MRKLTIEEPIINPLLFELNLFYIKQCNFRFNNEDNICFYAYGDREYVYDNASRCVAVFKVYLPMSVSNTGELISTTI